MKKILMLLGVIVAVFTFSHAVKAAEIEVNTVEELKNAVENADANVEVKLGGNFPVDENVELVVNHPHNIIINGANKKLKSRMFLNITNDDDDSNDTPKIEFKNFHFDGESKNAVGIEMKRDPDKHDKMLVRIIESVFENSTDSVLFFGTQKGDMRLLLSDLLIQNNISSRGGAIVFDDKVGVDIFNSEFKGNVNKSNTVGGGAITAIGKDLFLDIFNTVFNENKIVGKSEVGEEIGGGAIYVDVRKHRLTMGSNIFENNSTNLNESQQGGAILIKSENEEETSIEQVDITTSNFSNNTSSDSGGAISLLLKKSSYFDLRLLSNLFYSNTAKVSNTDKGGGAVNIYKPDSHYGTEMINITQNTFYKNNALNGKGGAINSTSFDSISFFDYNVFGENKGKENFKNSYFNIPPSDIKYTFGYDNGESPKFNEEQYFGIYPIKLTDNRGERHVGISKNTKVIQSISVIPQFTNDANEILKGFADLNKEEAYYGDLRRMYATFMTSGSVYNSSILYDANGGNFNLPQMKEFTGEEYYEGTTPKQYAELWLPQQEAVVKSGDQDLKIKLDGFRFKGWSTEKNGKPTAGYQPEDKFKIDGQVKLFAVWEDVKYPVKYFGNGHTSGVAPKMENSPLGEKLKVKDENSLKRTGYTFFGWSEKATATKADLQPGSEYKVKAKNNLYAVWQRNSNSVKYMANKATSGAAPKSAKVLYGNSVKLKNVGTMKRKGYTFLGWSSNKKATKAQYKVGKSLKITKPTSLFAVWKKK